MTRRNKMIHKSHAINQSSSGIYMHFVLYAPTLHQLRFGALLADIVCALCRLTHLLIYLPGHLGPRPNTIDACSAVNVIISDEIVLTSDESVRVICMWAFLCVIHHQTIHCAFKAIGLYLIVPVLFFHQSTDSTDIIIMPHHQFHHHHYFHHSFTPSFQPRNISFSQNLPLSHLTTCTDWLIESLHC